MVMIVRGLVGFGRPLLTGRADGEPVARTPYLGPFVALLGLLALPFVMAGAGAYDSPRRRDLMPLFGIVRPDVDVTRPTLLAVAQVAAWICFGGLLLGLVLHLLVGRRRRDDPTD